MPVNLLLKTNSAQTESTSLHLATASTGLAHHNQEEIVALSLTVEAASRKLEEWILNNPDSRQAELKALRDEITVVIIDDDYQRRLRGKAEDKANLLDTSYFFRDKEAASWKIPQIEQEWIATFIAVSVAVLADPYPKLLTLKNLDSSIRTFNKTYSRSGWNFSLVLFEQLCLNRFEINDRLSAALRLSGQGTKQPGEYGYRMAAMTLFLLGMHVKSSLSNELEYDLRPIKSLSLATEALRNPLNMHFQESVPKDLQPSILNNLKVGLLIFLYSSSKFWNQQIKELEPLHKYLRDNSDFLRTLVEEACARKHELSSIFIHAGSFWLHSNIFRTRDLPSEAPGSWDEILLSPNEGENIYWYRIILDGYIPEFLFQSFRNSPEKFEKKNSGAYEQFRQNLLLFLGQKDH